MKARAARDAGIARALIAVVGARRIGRLVRRGAGPGAVAEIVRAGVPVIRTGDAGNLAGAVVHRFGRGRNASGQPDSDSEEVENRPESRTRGLARCQNEFPPTGYG